MPASNQGIALAVGHADGLAAVHGDVDDLSRVLQHRGGDLPVDRIVLDPQDAVARTIARQPVCAGGTADFGKNARHPAVPIVATGTAPVVERRHPWGAVSMKLWRAASLSCRRCRFGWGLRQSSSGKRKSR